MSETILHSIKSLDNIFLENTLHNKITNKKNII